MNFTEKIEEILRKEAQAILDMRLKALQGLDRKKLQKESMTLDFIIIPVIL